MSNRVIAVIGGSGLYEAGTVRKVDSHKVETPWGATSAPIIETEIGDNSVFFLARHGAGHRIPPGQVPFRANIAALKYLGVDTIVSISAVGSLQEDMRPGDLVIPDQFIDRTRHRVDSFFEEGCVAHVSLADPFCQACAQAVADLIPEEVTVHKGGTYLCMEGPQFSTRAESHLYRSWGCSIIGMTNLTEARLAREAEICYTSLSFVTDYDCWRENEEAVTVDEILGVLGRNAGIGQQIIAALAQFAPVGECSCRTALDYALVTADKEQDPVLKRKLMWIARRVLKGDV